MGPRPRVLYIAGWGRSGSTLLERLLGQVPGFCPVGELNTIRYEKWPARTCGCGLQIHHCPFWGSALDAAFGAASVDRLGEFRRLYGQTVRHRHVPFLLRPGMQPAGFRANLKRVGELYAALYRGILQASKASIVVDASKLGVEALCLAASGAVDVYILHLVREPRAVAHSMRRVRKLAFSKGDRFLPRYGVVRSALEWTVRNLVAERGDSIAPYLRLRYEDLVLDPTQELRAIGEFVGQDLGSLDFIRDGTAILGEGHGLAGNPMRANSGRVALRLDDEWRRAMPFKEQVAVLALTWPARGLYAHRTTRT